MLTYNWLRWSAALSLPADNSNRIIIVDETGKANSVTVNSLTTNKMKVGDGTSPPSPNDYDLQSVWAETPPLPFSLSNPTPESWVLQVTGRFTPQTDKILAEIGIFVKGGFLPRWWMIVRDVLERPIPVPAGGSATIRYSLKSSVTGE